MPPSCVKVSVNASGAGRHVPLPSPGSAKVSINFHVPAKAVFETILESDLRQENSIVQNNKESKATFFIRGCFLLDKKNNPDVATGYKLIAAYLTLQLFQNLIQLKIKPAQVYIAFCRCLIQLPFSGSSFYWFVCILHR